MKKRLLGFAISVLLSGLLTWPAMAQSGRAGVGAIPYTAGAVHGVTFRVWAPHATSVAVAGNFNGWNPGELQMEKSSGGWQLNYVLAPGNYEYKFIVDGKWMTDPANPFKVGKGDFQNSVLVVQPNHTFILKLYPSAGNVMVTGSFNQWNADGWRMTKKDGQWILPVHLNPGKYTYKFVVDGKWIMDPMNDLWEDNEYGTGNSVVWIEP